MEKLTTGFGDNSNGNGRDAYEDEAADRTNLFDLQTPPTGIEQPGMVLRPQNTGDDLTPTPVAGEVKINSTTAGDQRHPSLTLLQNGEYVVVWESFNQDGSVWGLFGQIYNADGTAKGSEFGVNSTTNGNQRYPAIAPTDDGGFVVVWSSEGQDGSGLGIIGRRFDAAGSAQGGEFRVNSATTANQDNPSISALTGGGFVVTWESQGQDGSGFGVYGQQYDSDGSRVGSEFRINATTASEQYYSSVTGLNDGGYVVAFQSLSSGTFDISVQRYDAAGLAVGGEVRVNSNTSGRQEDASVAALENGGYVVTWQSETGDGSGWGIFAQQFNSLGGKVGSEFQVNSFTANNQVHTSVTSLKDGGYLVTWSSLSQDLSDYGVYGQRFDASGNAIGDEFIINETTSGRQWQNFIARTPVEQLDDGSVVVVWEGNGSGDSSGVFSRTFELPVNPTPAPQGGEFLVNTDAFGNQDQPSVAGLAGGGFVVSWHTFDSSQDGSATAIKAQLFDAAGSVVGGEFLVNTQAASDQISSRVTGLDGGGFVVTWVTFDSAQDGSGPAVKAQIFDALGAKVGNEFLVNTETTSTQNFPTVTGLSGGGFVATWSTNDTTQDGDSSAIKAQLFDASGAKVGNEFLVNTEVAGTQFDPAVAELSSGGFVLIWQTNDSSQDGSGSAIKAQLFDASGATVGGEFLVNTQFVSTQALARVVGLDSGNFVVTWTTADNTQDGSGQAVKAQLFDQSGNKIGSEFLVNTESVLNQTNPVVSSAPDGGFVIAWFSDDPLQDGSGPAIKAQLFDSNGAKVGEEFLVNDEVADRQGQPAIATLSDGNFVVSWVTDDPNQDLSGTAIKAKMFSIPGDEPLQAVEQTRLDLRSVITIEDADNPAEAVLIVSVEEGRLLFGGSVFVDSIAGNGTNTVSFTGSLEDINRTLDAAGNNRFEYLNDSGDPPPSDLLTFTYTDVTNGDAPVVQTRAIAIESVPDDSTLVVNPRFAGDEILVNEFGNGFATQFDPVITKLDGGRFVISFRDDTRVGDDTSGFAIRARLFESDGTPVGSTFLVNSTVTGSQFDPTITALDGGGFVVAYASANGPTDIRARIFDNDGTAVGADFIVDGQDPNILSEPVVTRLDGGGFVVVFSARDPATGQQGGPIFGAIFDASGNKVGSDFEIASDRRVIADEILPVVTAIDGGGFAVAWDTVNSGVANAGQGGFGDPSQGEVFVRVFNADGTAKGDAVNAATLTDGTQRSPSITRLDDGGFVVSWTDMGALIGAPRSDDGSFYAARAQVFANDGSKSGAELLLATTAAGSQFETNVTAIEGGFVAVWTDSSAFVEGRNTAADVRGQIYNNDGTKSGDEILVASDTRFEIEPDVFARSDGGFTVHWAYAGNFDFENGVGSRSFAADGTPLDDAAFANQFFSGFNPTYHDGVALDNGGYVLAWVAQRAGADIVARVFNPPEMIATEQEPFDLKGLILIGDDDSPDSVELVLSVDFGALDVSEGTSGATVEGSGSDEVTITGTLAQVQALLDTDATSAVTYTADADAPPESATLSTTLTDVTNGGTPVQVDETIKITSVDDPSTVEFVPQGPLSPIGDEFRVNTTENGGQQDLKVTGLESGGYVAVWLDRAVDSSDTSDDAIRAQLFGSDGAPVGDEFLVSSQIGGKNQAEVTSLSNGGFAIAWRDDAPLPTGGNSIDVLAQIFDSSGAKVGGEILVPASTQGFQQFPKIASLSDGGFVVTWTDTSGTGGDNDDFGIRYQIFDNDGVAVGPEGQANTTITGRQDRPEVQSLSNGDFVIVWEDRSASFFDVDLKAQVFGSDGSKKGTEISVNQSTPGNQVQIHTEELANGNFVIGWVDNGSNTGDTDPTAVRFQVFAADGTAIGSERLANSTTAGDQSEPDFVALAGGGFVVTWQDNSASGDDTSSFAVRAQIFANDGTKIGDEFLVNTTTAGAQVAPELIALENGGFFGAWLDSGVPNIIKGQEFAADGSKVGEELDISAVSPSAGTPLDLVEYGRGNIAAFWIDRTGGSQNADIQARNLELPSNFNAIEEESLDLKGQIFVDDPDNPDSVEVVLSVDTGVLDVTVGTSGALVSDSGTNSVTITGTLAQVQALLESDATSTVTYTNNSDAPPAMEDLTVTISDVTNSGEAVEAAETINIENTDDPSTVDLQPTAPAAVRVGDEILVNSATENSQRDADVTGLNGGGFVVVWEDNSLGEGGTGGDDSQSAIKGQVFADDGTPLGDEILVNTATSSTQFDPVVTSLGNGGFVVVWEDFSGGTGGAMGDNFQIALKAQVFAADGAPVGDEILVNTATVRSQQNAQVTALEGGGFAVTWEDNSGSSGSGNFNLGFAVKSQIFADDGSKVGGELLLNERQQRDQELPEIAALANGGFAVVWTDESGPFEAGGGDNSNDAVRGRVVAANGSFATSEFLVNTATEFDQDFPKITSLSNGGFVVTWIDGSRGIDGNGATGDDSADAIKAQVFAANGAKVGGEILVNTATNSTQTEPQIVELENGRFAIAWSDFSRSNGGAEGDDSGFAVKAQVFEANGSKVGTEILVNSATFENQRLSSIEALPGGGFIITFNDQSEAFGGARGDRDGFAVKGQIFDNDGAPVGREFLINSATAGDQQNSQIVTLSNGDFAVVWQDGSLGIGGATGDDSDLAVKAQVFSVGTVFEATEQVALDLKGQIAADDPDNPDSVELVVSADTGIITATAGTSGASVAGSGTSVVTITGTLAQVQALIDSDATSTLTYTIDNDDPPLRENISVAFTDITNSGETVRDAEVVEIEAVNDPSVADVADDLVATEQAPLDLKGEIIVDDPDNPDDVTVQISVVSGVLEATEGTSGATVNQTAPNALTITGTLEQVKALLESDATSAITYTADSDAPPASADLTVSIIDHENRGDSVSDIQSITINSLDDPSRVDFVEAGTVVKTGDDFTAHTTVEGTQVFEGVTELVGGGLVAVYTDFGDSASTSGEVRAQVFDADGQPVGPDILVNTITEARQERPSITALSDGGFAVTWIDRSDPAAFAIRAQVFDADGEKVGNEFLVPSPNENFNNNPTIEAFDNGTFVVVWSNNDSSSGSEINQLQYQLFNNDGSRIGTQQVANTPSEDRPSDPLITELPDGGFLLTWPENDTSARFTQLKARVFDENGAPTTDVVLISAFGRDENFVERLHDVEFRLENRFVTVLDNGNIAIGYTAEDRRNSDRNDVFVQIIEPDGTKVGSIIPVATEVAQDQDQLQGIALAGGGFAVSWSDSSRTGGDTDSDAVRARIFDSDGQAIGAPILVNSTTASAQNNSSLVALQDGGFLVTWHDFSLSSTDESTAVRAQQFAADGTKVGEEFVATTTTLGAQTPVGLLSLSDGKIVQFFNNSGADNFNDVRAQVLEAQDFEAVEQQPLDLKNKIILEDPDNPESVEVVLEVDTGVLNVEAGTSGAVVQGSGTAIVTITGTLAQVQALLGTDTTSVATYTADSDAPPSTDDLTVTLTDVTNSSDAADATETINVESVDDPSTVTFVATGPTASTGDEILVNDRVSEEQFNIVTETLADGRVLVTWMNRGPVQIDIGIDIRAQVFAADGTAIGTEFIVSSPNVNTVFSEQAVTALPNGGFVVTWRDQTGVTGDKSSGGISARIFGPDGAPNGDSFLANTTKLGIQGEPEASPIGDGQFIIVWSDASELGADRSSRGIRAQVFNDDGTTVGNEIEVNTTAISRQYVPEVNLLENGNAFVFWLSNSLGAGEIRGQIIAPDGTKVGNEIAINSTLGSGPREPVYAELADGSFVIAWQTTRKGNQDGVDTDIRFQQFASDGSKLGGEVLANTTIPANQVTPAITALAGGGFVLTWEDQSALEGDIDGSAVRAQVFDAQGNKVGSEILANSVSGDRQADPSVVALSTGGFVIAWEDSSGSVDDPSPAAVRAQEFAADGAKIGDEILVPTNVLNSQINPQLNPLENGRFIAFWEDFSGASGDAILPPQGRGDVRGQVFEPSFGATEQTALDLKGQVLVDDPDNPDSVEVVLGVDTGILDITAGTSGAVVSDSGTNSVTITGTLAQVKALLESDASSAVTYTADSDAPPSMDELTVTITDVTNNGTPISDVATITIDNVNDVPEGAENTLTTDEDVPFTFAAEDFGFRDVDTDDSLQSVRIDTLPASGALTFDGEAVTQGQEIAVGDLGLLVFTPDENENGEDYASFTFSVSDGEAFAASPSAITFDVTAVNDAPEGADNSFTIDEDTAYTFAAEDFGFRDVDTGDTLQSVRITTLPSDGVLELDGVAVTEGQEIEVDDIELLTFTPDKDANGDGYASFTFQVSDGADEDAAPNTITFDVTGVNDAPVVAIQTPGNGFAKQGSEIAVNSATEGNQQEAFITALPNGGFAVVWEDASLGIGGATGDTSGTAVKLQVYGSDGLPAGGEVLVNAGVLNNQADPKITTLEDGNFVVIWEDFSFGNGGATGDPSGAAVKARIYDQAGSALTGEILVNTATNNGQFDPQIAALSDGGFAITWEDDSLGVGGATGDSTGRAIKAQVFEADGTPAGSELLVNTAVFNPQGDPAIAATTDGGFVITWRDSSFSNGGATGDNSGDSIKAQIFDASGNRSGGEFLVNSAIQSGQITPAVKSLEGGNFVIAWRDDSNGVGGATGDTSGPAIKAQVYTVDGAPIGSEILVNTATASNQVFPSTNQLDPIVALEGGRFAIVWDDFSQGVTGTQGDESNWAVKAQVFEADGTKVGAEILVNSATTGPQQFESVTALPGGGFLVTFRDSSLGEGAPGDTSQHAVKAQIIDGDGLKVGDEFLVNTQTTRSQVNSDSAALTNGGFAVVWRDDSQDDGSFGGIDAQIFEHVGFAFQATEQVALDLKGAITIEDVDAGEGDLTATLTVDFGVLDVDAGTSGATIVSGNGSGEVVIEGTLAELNALLESDATSTLTFTADSDTPPSLTNLSVSVDDNGNTGTGGAQVGDATAEIAITSVDDPSTVDVADDLLATEEPLDLKGQITVDDPDNPDLVQVIISATNGTLGVTAGGSDAAVNVGPTGDVTIIGALAQVKALLDSDATSTLTFTADDDSSLETAELSVTITDLTNGGDAVNDTETITLDLADPGILSIADASVLEGDSGTTQLTFTVTRTDGADGEVSVDYDTTAAATNSADDLDFAETFPGSGTITFADGQTSETITVLIQGDTTFEGDESFVVTLSNPTGDATLDADGTTATGTILNDDPVPEISLSVSSANPSEDAGTVTLTATLSNPSTQDITVDLLYGGTASEGSDYATPPTSITILAGQMSGTASLSITDDDVFEADETVIVTLDNPSNAVLSATGQQTITISDNDATPTLSITDVTIVEGDSGTTDFVFTITRTGATELATTFDAEVVLGTGVDAANASDLNDPGKTTLTIEADESSATYTVSVNGDFDVEGDEVFSILLSSATNATIADDTGIGTITNDDFPSTVAIEDGLAATEQTALDLKGEISLDDANNPDSVTVVLSVDTGVLEITAGGSGASVEGSGTSQVTITGSLTAVQALLDTDLTSTATYTADSDTPPTSDDLTVSITDVTNNGETAEDTETIAITSVDDPSSADVAVGLEATEQTPLDLKGQIALDDPDNPASVSVVLSVDTGVLEVAAGGSGASVEGSGTSEVTITGSLAAVQALLDSDATSTATYTADSDAPPASDDLTVSITDVTNAGESVEDTETIAITAVNDPSAANVSEGLEATEQVALDLKGEIAVDDPDNPDSVSVTLTVDTGVLEVTAGGSGANVEGSGTNAVTITGSLAAVQALLDSDATSTVAYTADSDTPPTSDDLTVSITDVTNSGDAVEDTESIAITSVDDPSSADVTEGLSATEQVALDLKGEIAVDDPDNPDSVSVVLSVDTGVLSVTAGSSGANVQGSGTSEVTITGSLAAVQALLDSDATSTVTYTADSDTPPSADDLTVSITDITNDGEAVEDTESIAITSVDDPSGVDFGAGLEAVERIALDLKGQFTLADADNPDSVSVVLSVETGVLDVTAGASGANVEGSGTNQVTIAGSLAAVQALLSNDATSTVTYTADSETPPPSDDLTIALTDLTNGGETVEDTETILITSVFDGDSGSDDVTGTDGKDIVDASGGNDSVNGLGGDDVLGGGSGNDTIFGAAGDDTIDAGSGNDVLGGGSGADVMTGGSGRDTFVVEAGKTLADADIITDFRSTDRIAMVDADGRDIVIRQAGRDTEILADGVLVVTLLGVRANRVTNLVEYEGTPASIDAPNGRGRSRFRDEFDFSSFDTTEEPEDTGMTVTPTQAGGVQVTLESVFGSSLEVASADPVDAPPVRINSEDQDENPWVIHGIIGVDGLI